MIYTNCITTTHQLAKELLSNPDGFLTASDENREMEYVIEGTKRKSTHKNIDDSEMYWTLSLRCVDGYIKR